MSWGAQEHDLDLMKVFSDINGSVILWFSFEDFTFYSLHNIVIPEILYDSFYVEISLRYSWDLMLLFVCVHFFMAMLVLEHSSYESFQFS